MRFLDVIGPEPVKDPLINIHPAIIVVIVVVVTAVALIIAVNIKKNKKK